MITIALDTATDRCTVAASRGDQMAERNLLGARRHAAAVLQLLDEVLTEVGGTARQIDRVVTADGPGSFTGLRVAATVAKALTWRRNTTWYTAPSLLVRAIGHVPEGGGRVLALSDALRGEVYAGCWDFSADGTIAAVGGPLRAVLPIQLSAFGSLAVVVGTLPEALQGQVMQVLGRGMIAGEAALPNASQLLRLVDRPGGTTSVENPVLWEPDYGRPAEAQAVWEKRHGRALPDTPNIAR